jgi:formate transporter
MKSKPPSDEVAAPQVVTFDAILPASMAVRAEQSGVTRAATDPLTVFVLSILAGAFVAFGAIFATTVTAGGGLSYGVGRLLTGLVFSAGLVMVIIAGAELFTGNNLIVMAWASRKIRTSALLLNWVLSFSGNFVGAIATAVLVFYSTQYTFGDGAVGLVALNIANAKSSLQFIPALILGILCNALVCLAVWMLFSARTNIDRIVRPSLRSPYSLQPASNTASPISTSSQWACSSKRARLTRSGRPLRRQRPIFQS